MERSSPEYLIDKLLTNELSKEELDKFLTGLGENEMSPEYATILEKHFNQLITEHDNQVLVYHKEVR